jgi:shikimate dehydrogenase
VTPGSTLPLRAGLIGAGIGASLSPALHEAEAEAQGVQLTYALFDSELDPRPLTEVLAAAYAAGFAGVNITHPYKQSVLNEVGQVAGDAREVGAVNTVRFESGRMVGHNTDARGYAEAFRRQMPGADLTRVVQCGAGGAGAAVAHAQLEAGVAHLVLHEPDAIRRQALLSDLRHRFGPERVSEAGSDLVAELANATGLVNASPVGMVAHPGLPVPKEGLHDGLWVSDVVYMPVETELLRTARDRGLRTLSGVHMCVHQAAGAFEIFTGLTPDVDRMSAHLRRLLGEREVAGHA